MDTFEIFTDMDMQGFSRRLTRARHQSGLKQCQVAEYADLNVGNYNQLERGKRSGLRAETLYRLCLILRVSADYLLGIPGANS